MDYDKYGNAILLLLSELIKNFSKAKAKTPEFQPLPRFEPTSNPATSKKPMDQLVNPPLPKSQTPNHENGFQEIAAPGGATENFAPVTDPVTPAAAAANPMNMNPLIPPPPLLTTRPILVVLDGTLEPTKTVLPTSENFQLKENHMTLLSTSSAIGNTLSRLWQIEAK